MSTWACSRAEGKEAAEAKGLLLGGIIPDSGPTIFAALEQIGLKLESRKMPLAVIVVDHVDRPPEK